MPSLPELQSAVMCAALGGDVTQAAAFLAHDGVDPAQRLGIYAHTARSNFIASLRSSYPVLLRLVGDAYFVQLAGQFHMAHPSRSGDLLHTGEHLAEFLADRHGAGEYAYLDDVAHFEWLCQASLLAANHAPLAHARLEHVAADAYDALRFILHPAARLFASAFPIHLIWQTNADAQQEPPLIDLHQGGERLLILTRHLQLQFLSLDAGEYAFLQALAGMAPLGEAIEAAAAIDPCFDAGACLRRFVGALAIVDFR